MKTYFHIEDQKNDNKNTRVSKLVTDLQGKKSIDFNLHFVVNKNKNTIKYIYTFVFYMQKSIIDSHSASQSVQKQTNEHQTEVVILIWLDGHKNDIATDANNYDYSIIFQRNTPIQSHTGQHSSKDGLTSRQSDGQTDRQTVGRIYDFRIKMIEWKMK